MKQYEYTKIVMGEDIKEFNTLGLEGWELIHIENNKAIFKRELNPVSKKQLLQE